MKTLNKFSKVVFALAIVALTLSSCKKDESITPTSTAEPTKKDFLVNGEWILKSSVVNGDDVTSLLEDCVKDNISIFKADGIYISDEGATKCDPNDKQVVKGKWEFKDNKTKIIIDNNDPVSVKTLTKDTLRISAITFKDNNVYASEITYINNQ